MENTTKRTRNDNIKQKGFTLLEVLISLILLSFILLGFDAMQIYSLRITQNAYYTHVATQQINSMIEILHTPSMINQQQNNWNLQNAQLLPSGKGEVIGNSPNYQITVSWINASISHCIQRNIKI